MHYSIVLLLLLSCSNAMKVQSDSFAVSVSHTAWDNLLKKHVNSEGDVAYSDFLTDKEALSSYLEMLAKNPISDSAAKQERLAYYINLYNAGTVQLILDNYPVQSIKDISRPWDKDWVMVGNKAYSLGDIEHKILRKMNEPRIHFAINCASYSCPKLLNEAFSAATIETQLEAAAIAFINDPKRNKFTTETAQISEIFKWFKKDFTTTGSVISYLNSYTKTKLLPTTKIKYLDYDWSLNESTP